MTYLFVDLFALILIAAGVVIAFRRPSRTGSLSAREGDNAGIYVRRIGGIMLAAFGLALAVMFTTFHFALPG